MAVDRIPRRSQVVFLLDVDNTLIDNDRGRVLMAEATERLLGTALSKEYWRLYEEVRKALGYVDSLETLERFQDRHGDPSQGRLARAILDFDYADIRFPETLDVLAALRAVGTPVVLSDGDPVFQGLKIARAGVADAVDDNVLVFAHKEEHLEDVALLFPAEHYVAVDDKAAILARIKTHWDRRVRTVHVLQGKYADDGFDGPRPDAVIGRIGELAPLVGTEDALRVFLEGASIRGPA
jgi:FMN phosphatase YigB (HAD superfamily)